MRDIGYVHARSVPIGALAHSPHVHVVTVHALT
jgi:hypothetical protein